MLRALKESSGSLAKVLGSSMDVGKMIWALWDVLCPILLQLPKVQPTLGVLATLPPLLHPSEGSLAGPGRRGYWRLSWAHIPLTSRHCP